MNSTIRPSACKTCGSPYHSAMYHKPRKAIVTTKPLPRPTKRIKKIGKHGDLWQQAKAQWFKKNYKQHYTCHYCGSLLNNAQITLDHKTSRSRAPSMRYDLSNLVPCCFPCNGLKGSVDHDSYEHDCPDNVKEKTR